MTSQAVAQRDSQVPALRNTPALEITAEDIAIPRIYTGHYSSGAVQEGRVKPGDLYAAQNADDPDPVLLWSPGAKGDNPGVDIHVLSMHKAKSIIEGGELQLFDYSDPNAPEDAWITYNYLVALPAVDPDVPFKLLLTRSNRPTALKINMVLKKNSISGPAWNSAFRVTTAPRANDKGKWFVVQASPVTPTAEQVATAEALGLLVAASPAPAPTNRGDEPSI